MLGSILGIRHAKVENEAQEFAPREIGRASVMMVFVLNQRQISQSTYFSKIGNPKLTLLGSNFCQLK